MTAPHPVTFGLLLCAATFVVAGPARAESTTCVEGSTLWSAPVAQSSVTDVVASIVGEASGVVVAAVIVADPAPLDSVPWCVDSADPRCSPDPEGEHSSRSLRATTSGQLHRGVNVPVAPEQDESSLSHAVECDRDGFVATLERPPR